MRQLCGEEGTLIQAELNRPIELSMLAPDDWLELPWAGHYGLSQLRQVAPKLSADTPSLVFTNTRAQAETWFEALRTIRFDYRIASPCITAPWIAKSERPSKWR